MVVIVATVFLNYIIFVVYMSTQTVGYYKDFVATIVFLFALVLFLSRGIRKEVLVMGLLACILIDGMFTLNPTWHCKPIGKNNATYALIAQCIIASGIMIYALLH